ncbi:MAG: ATP-binding protein [Candidatus Limnocylindrales bacterium]
MTDASVASELQSAGDLDRKAQVRVSLEVVRLLSMQLYSSPLKAIEELVVNAWDADASRCWVRVSESDADAPVVVLDDGEGMDATALADLWHVGHSLKRDDDWVRRHRRRQIGKFGIGKLATYALGRQVTYASRHGGEVRSVSLDFDRLLSSSTGNGTSEPIDLDVLRTDPTRLADDGPFGAAVHALGLEPSQLLDGTIQTWTLVIIERLRDERPPIKHGRLRWVLETAMPLAPDFELALNGSRVESAKDLDADWVVDFTVAQLDAERVKELASTTGIEWEVRGESLVNARHPDGIRGRVRVAAQSLYYGKSIDLGRSHGIFVRVRNRLINEDDPLFGATPLSFTTFYNLHAVIEADDLDENLKAPRDDVEQGLARSDISALLRQLFNQARDRYERVLAEREEQEKRKREGVREYVAPRLLERPLADALLMRPSTERGSAWLHVDPGAPGVADQLVEDLYADPPKARPYSYRTSTLGPNNPFVRFLPESSEFILNEDHPLVLEFWENPSSRRLLRVVATAEALLEVYLRDSGLRPEETQLLLGRRDELLRSLASAHQYSLRSLAKALRDARNDERDLEVAVVAALRALGFVTQQVSGSGEPDGTAHYTAHDAGPAFTLEAKSSASVPSLGAIDFAGLRSHADAHKADGCLLVAPAYPGLFGELTQSSRRARQERVSCWTIEDLASVVENAEARHVNADRIREIVLGAFSPGDVRRRVKKLLGTPAWTQRELARAVLSALAGLEGKMSGSPRDISMIATAISLGTLESVEVDDVRAVVLELAHASRGMLYLADDGKVFVRGSLEELRRRVASHVDEDAAPRRGSPFMK